MSNINQDIISDKTPKSSQYIMYVWDKHVAAIWDKQEKDWSSLCATDGDPKYVREIFQRNLWKAGSYDLEIVSDDNNGRRRSPAGTYYIRDLPEPFAYVGDPTPASLAERLMVRDGGNRFALLIGSSGAGKSTLARLTAKAIDPNVKLLKMTASFINNRNGVTNIVDIIKYFGPDILLIDDMQTIIDDEQMMLSLMESFHEQNGSLIIGTYMKDDIPSDNIEDLKPGELYFPGMRPGRIDDVILIPRPNYEARKEILEFYLKKEPSEKMVKDTVGLTGAYLKELSYRIDNHGGMDTWEEELRRLTIFLPVQYTRENENDT